MAVHRHGREPGHGARPRILRRELRVRRRALRVRQHVPHIVGLQEGEVRVRGALRVVVGQRAEEQLREHAPEGPVLLVVLAVLVPPGRQIMRCVRGMRMSKVDCGIGSEEERTCKVDRHEPVASCQTHGVRQDRARDGVARA
jgi:hypothetical protein